MKSSWSAFEDKHKLDFIELKKELEGAMQSLTGASVLVVPHSERAKQFSKKFKEVYTHDWGYGNEFFDQSIVLEAMVAILEDSKDQAWYYHSKRFLSDLLDGHIKSHSFRDDKLNFCPEATYDPIQALQDLKSSIEPNIKDIEDEKLKSTITNFTDKLGAFIDENKGLKKDQIELYEAFEPLRMHSVVLKDYLENESLKSPFRKTIDSIVETLASFLGMDIGKQALRSHTERILKEGEQGNIGIGGIS